MNCPLCTNKKLGLTVAALIFAIVGLLHLLRIITHMAVSLNGNEIPFAASWIALIGASLLSYWMWSLRNQP